MASLDFVDQPRPLTVSEVNREANALLEGAYSNIWVEGEISEYKIHQPSGHHYFSLKDEAAALSATIWRGQALRLRFQPRVGMQVVAFGKLGIFERQGRFQLYVEHMVAQGEGALDQAFRKLKEKLFELGYFDPARKRLVPTEPQTIGIVTSPTGAAIRDMLETLSRRWPSAAVVLSAVRVQGPGAAEEIAGAIQRFNQLHESGTMPIDVLLIGRGGGSIEDLWAFNERAVADAIFDSTIPVVSGVGHETDWTIADLVADLRAPTPTAAAELVTPDRLERMSEMNAAAHRLKDGLLRRLERARQRVADMGQRRPFRHPLDRMHDLGRRLDELGERIQRRWPLERIHEFDQQLARWRERCDRGIRASIDRWSVRFAGITAQLEALSPLAVLARGYSLTAQANGSIVRSVEELRPGDLVTTRLSRGEFTSQVQSVHAPPVEGNEP